MESHAYPSRLALEEKGRVWKSSAPPTKPLCGRASTWIRLSAEGGGWLSQVCRAYLMSCVMLMDGRRATLR